MGQMHSVEDCENVVDLIHYLGNPHIKKRISIDKDVYIWKDYTAIIKHENGQIIKIHNKPITQI